MEHREKTKKDRRNHKTKQPTAQKWQITSTSSPSSSVPPVLQPCTPPPPLSPSSSWGQLLPPSPLSQNSCSNLVVFLPKLALVHLVNNLFFLPRLSRMQKVCQGYKIYIDFFWAPTLPQSRALTGKSESLTSWKKTSLYLLRKGFFTLRTFSNFSLDTDISDGTLTVLS